MSEQGLDTKKLAELCLAVVQDIGEETDTAMAKDWGWAQLVSKSLPALTQFLQHESGVLKQLSTEKAAREKIQFDYEQAMNRWRSACDRSEAAEKACAEMRRCLQKVQDCGCAVGAGTMSFDEWKAGFKPLYGSIEDALKTDAGRDDIHKSEVDAALEALRKCKERIGCRCELLKDLHSLRTLIETDVLPVLEEMGNMPCEDECRRDLTKSCGECQPCRANKVADKLRGELAK